MTTTIIHVVFFQFKPELAAEERREVCKTPPWSDLSTTMAPPALYRMIATYHGADATLVQLCDQMLELKNRCMHPATAKPYIKSSVGGLDMSIEGMQDGLTHAFVVEFQSQEDRDYYVQEDPAHKAFVESMLQRLAKARILDFSPGVF
ncbi:hypothetical protein TOPH_02021 [Tolypocladium ophioglossoides CBS 100239]|uniref:Stress-response A/B barrel domain-containing protein n=1 Tax=Tolypocladium ophioglossoides (strain CBS 100239) TaxID=1163406 RepID=A0A0L0NGT8_TOLOC|nr:hypothetical protein TOPH_02021 [Tolypocladium ophioglossoides CBS 100239]